MIALNRYQNGLVSYPDVVYALTAVLAKRAATQIGGQRMGGWSRRQISRLSRRPAVEQNRPRAGAGEAGQSLVHAKRLKGDAQFFGRHLCLHAVNARSYRARLDDATNRFRRVKRAE